MSKKNDGSGGMEIIENPEVLAERIGSAESFFVKNKNLLTIAGGGILVVLMAFAGYRFYMDGQEETAQIALSNAVYDFEADSLQRALKGSGGNEGLINVADNYKGTDAANLANLYAGIAHLKDGNYDEAITRLKGFSSSDLLMYARAQSLIGDAYMEKGSVEDAISFYKKAASYKENQFFTPGYLIKLGIAQEKANQNKEAMASYKRIIDEFPLSTEVANAKKFLGVLEGQVGE